MSLEELRQNVQQLALEFQSKGDLTGWFDKLYHDAQGDASKIPWAKLNPHPYLEEWLNRSQIEKNQTALVIGCGLGDDAEILSQNNYTVTAFDISPTAIAWCLQRFPESQVNYQVADLLEREESWQGQFDWVFECRTIQALPLEIRDLVIAAIVPLVSPQGMLMVITRLREDDQTPFGPPWPLSNLELTQFERLGLKEIQRSPYLDPNNPSIPQICILYQRKE